MLCRDIDPVLSRAGLRARDSFRLLRRNMLEVIVFGAIGSLIVAIPLVGWFLGPTYCVIAGVHLGLLLLDATEREMREAKDAAEAGPEGEASAP